LVNCERVKLALPEAVNRRGDVRKEFRELRLVIRRDCITGSLTV
jgi:hypothetical protein